MSTSMTSRERILAAIRIEPVDYVPCCGFFNPLDPKLRVGYTWNFPWAEEAPVEEQIRYQVEQLGLDQVVSVSVVDVRPAANVTQQTRLEGDVLHKTYTTSAGELHAAVRFNELWPHGRDIPLYSDFNIGHFVEPWIKTANDLECLKQLQVFDPVGHALDSVSDPTRELTLLARRYGLATAAHVGTGLTGAQQLFGATDLCMMTMDQPDLVDAYLEHEHGLNLRRIELYGSMGTDIIMRNGFYETADFYSPDMIERFLGRRLRAEAEAIRRAGMVSAYTIHTGVMPIIDYLADLSFDSFRGIDIAFKDIDLNEIRDKIAPTKAIWTGPSSTYHLWKGPEATRQAVRDVFECFGKRGLILCQCVSSHSIMPWESTLAMIEEWKKLRGAQ